MNDRKLMQFPWTNGAAREEDRARPPLRARFGVDAGAHCTAPCLSHRLLKKKRPQTMRQPVRSHKDNYVKWLCLYLGFIAGWKGCGWDGPVLVAGPFRHNWALCDSALKYAPGWQVVRSLPPVCRLKRGEERGNHCN